STPLEPFVVAVDAKGRTWFGDRMLGLGYVRDDGRLGFLTTQDGLPDNHVWDVQPEDDGGLWITTGGGLCHYRAGVWSHFDPDGGLAIPQLWPVLPLADRVYVGTLGGGLQVLSRAEASDRPPRVAILPPLIDKGVAHVRWRALSYWGATMRAGLDTRYRIDARPWTPWSRERSIVLSDLRAGRHTIQVQAKGLFGGYDPAGATAELEIPLPLVLRPLFAVPIGALTTALVVLGIVAARRKRRAEAVVRDSEERFRMLSEAAFEGIGVNENGVIVEANRRLAEMLGCELRELIGSPVVEFVAPESHALVQSRMVGESDDRRGPYEHLARRRDGSMFPVEVQGRAVRFRGREARVSAVRDITDRKRAEEALRVSEDKFSKAFRLSPGPSTITRLRDGLVVEANDAFVEASGFPRDRLLGSTTLELIWATPAERAMVVAELEAHGRVLAREVRVRTAAGEYRDFFFSAELIDLGGEPHVLGVSMDITERKRAERELRASREQLQALSRRLIDAQESERAAIARELHDEIGQALTAVKLNLQGIGRLVPDERVAGHVAEGVGVLDAAMESVRDLALDLRPSLLDDLGLVAALRWYT
ncbi:MAG: PAS domain S-box protein, partial [Acidimicrobiales bacterium]